MKAYVDGSWFRPFTKAIREQMMEDAKKMLGDGKGPGNISLFDPSSTQASKDFDKETNPEKRVAIAKRIYKDNIEHINESNILIYGAHENDLGTASDLGNALRLNKDIFCYDYLSRIFNKIDNDKVLKELKNLNTNKIHVFNKKNGMDMGVAFGFHSDKKLMYLIDKGLADNIMLRMNHKKFIINYLYGECKVVPETNTNIDEIAVSNDEISLNKMEIERTNKYELNFDAPKTGLFDPVNVIVTSVS